RRAELAGRCLRAVDRAAAAPSADVAAGRADDCGPCRRGRAFAGAVGLARAVLEPAGGAALSAGSVPVCPMLGPAGVAGPEPEAARTQGRRRAAAGSSRSGRSRSMGDLA